MRSDWLNEAAGGRQRCSFNQTDYTLSFCVCVEGKPDPVSVWSHWWAAWRCCIWVTIAFPIWPICSSAGSPILKHSSCKVCMVIAPTVPHKAFSSVKKLWKGKHQERRLPQTTGQMGDENGRKERQTFFSPAPDGFDGVCFVSVISSHRADPTFPSFTFSYKPVQTSVISVLFTPELWTQDCPAPHMAL